MDLSTFEELEKLPECTFPKAFSPDSSALGLERVRRPI